MKYKDLNACPICGQQEIYQLLVGIDRLHKVNGSWPLWRCKSCHVGFLNPMPNSDIIGDFYPQDYYAYTPPCLPSMPTSAFKRFFWHWKQQRKAVQLIQLGYPNIKKPHLFFHITTKFIAVKQQLPSHVKNGALLDIGCGAGHYLLEMKDLGWNTTGVELTPSACDAAKQANLNVFQGTLEDYHFENDCFDIVRMSDVLEHVPNPHETLKEIYRILKPNGYLELTLPNLDAWTFELFGEYWFPLEIPRHLFHHTPESIKQLAHQHHFKVSQCHIWSHKEVDVIPSLQWYLQENKPFLYKFLNHKAIWKIIRKLFVLPKSIAVANGKGSAMTITLLKSEASYD